MSEIKREITVRKCDFCSEIETISIGIPRDTQIFTKIYDCEKCGRHTCKKHLRNSSIAFTGFGSYGNLNTNLCPTCEADLKKVWEALLAEYGVKEKKTPF